MIRRVVAAVAGVLALAGAGFGEEALTGPFPRTAQPLLDEVIARLPDVPLVIEADLIVRRGAGEADVQYKVDMELDWWADPPTATYTVRDRFAAPLSHLSVTWQRAGRTATYRYFEGDPLKPAPTPELQAPVYDSDLSWSDLSLSFLWWRGGAIVGVASVRGRDCLVVDLPLPPDVPMVLGGVRLWVDPRIGMLLRAESFDERGDRIRRMDVKSFKKINDRWVIKDIEFRRYPSTGQSTLLRVRNVEDRERFELPER